MSTFKYFNGQKYLKSNLDSGHFMKCGHFMKYLEISLSFLSKYIYD